MRVKKLIEKLLIVYAMHGNAKIEFKAISRVDWLIWNEYRKIIDIKLDENDKCIIELEVKE